MPAWLMSKLGIYLALGLVIAILAGSLWVQTGRLGAAHDTIKALNDKVALRDSQITTLGEDVTRNKASLTQCQGIINDQAQELAQHKADAAKAQTVADERAAAQAVEIADLNNQLDDMKARAREHPDQVRPLGPIVRDVLDRMQPAGKAPTP